MTTATETKGSYIRTYCGVQFSVLNPSEEDLVNGDFINVLPRIPRFGGHTSRFYSVAEHTFLVRNLAIKNNSSQDLIDACLLHDFSEVYLCDLPSPYKDEIPKYNEIEEKIQKCIYEKYKCERYFDEVKYFDIVARHIEAYYLMPNFQEDWSFGFLVKAFEDFEIIPFETPKFWSRWKLRRLLMDLCKRKNIKY